MKKIIAVIALVCLVQPLLAAPGDPLTWRDSTWDYRSEDPGDTTRELSVAKTVGVASSVLIAYGAAYWLVFHKGWWDEQGNHFHFENDFDYALNLDKFGHFAAGVILGESFYEAYHWAGVSEFQSYLYAGLSAMATHIAIERAVRNLGRFLADGGTLHSRVQVRGFEMELLDQYEGVLQAERYGRVYRRLLQPDFLGVVQAVPPVAGERPRLLPELACLCRGPQH